MLRYTILFITIITITVFGLTGCDSDKVDTYYTFTGETMGQFLKDRPDQYSEFYKMLELTGVSGLLKAYGDYTGFIPNNTAIQNYYEKEGIGSLEEMAIDSVTKLVYNHIIKGFEIQTADFDGGFLPRLTMSGRYLKIDFEASNNGLVYRVNDNSTITTPNIEVHNGVIHQIDQVLSPTENNMVEAIAEEEKFSLYYKALIQTGLDRELLLVKDNDYVPSEALLEEVGNLNGIGSIIRTPIEKKYGFTAFIESNETYAANGINSIEDMVEYAKSKFDPLYPGDAGITDFTDRKNSLNRFVAYHLVNKKMPRYFLIEAFDNTGNNYEITGETHSVKSVDMYEYVETMCPNTLMEVRTLRSTNEYDVINMLGSGEAIRLTDDYDNDALNGVFHEIDGILSYSQEVERMLTSKRMRMDGASFFPELANNNIRVGSARDDYPSERWKFPQGFFERVETSETTTFGYFNSDDRFLDYQGDEIFLSGLYDFSVITLPIPAGTYEVRFGYQPTGNRGAAQLYWDGVPTGIPLDLRLLASNAKVGYVRPGSDPADPEGYENDKMMRNRGYMKAPASFKVIRNDWYDGASARMSDDCLRKVLGIYVFDETTTHKFTVKASRSGEFMLDYLEFVPLEVLENEDIY